jgi:hypothetical protein
LTLPSELEEGDLASIPIAVGEWQAPIGSGEKSVMNQGEIYAKTEEGVRELKERQRSLPSALRSVLIMVDGNRTVAEVLERSPGIARRCRRARDLEGAGLIAKRFSAPSSADPEAASTPRSESETQQFLAAQKKLMDAINEHLGVRGYMMMMRLQRANNLRDLHDLLPDFAKAMVKRVGSMRRRRLSASLSAQSLAAAEDASARGGREL